MQSTGSARYTFVPTREAAPDAPRVYRFGGTLAYVTGAEVLWRQLRAPVFYLAAPYVVILLSSFAVLLVLRRLGKDARLAVLYAALLLPATVATVRTAGAAGPTPCSGECVTARAILRSSTFAL